MVLFLRFTTQHHHYRIHLTLFRLTRPFTFRDILFERSTKIFTVGDPKNGYHSNSVSTKDVIMINIVTAVG